MTNIERSQARKARVSRVLDLSGFVARNLSGCHSRLKEVADETGEAVTGDTEDEI